MFKTKRGGGGQHSLAVLVTEGANSDDWKESLALCILCAQGISWYVNHPFLDLMVFKLLGKGTASRDEYYFGGLKNQNRILSK